MALYVPGGTENTIKDTYLRQFWSESCGYSGWCGAFQLYAPPGWHADPAFKETGYCCGGHGGCAYCIMTLSQAIADYPTEVTFVSNLPGAQIFIDGVEWWPGAITDADGATFRGISPGTHTYELRMAGYQTVTGTFELALDTPITVPLPTGSASFSSVPAGAEIFLDGQDQNIKTPATITDVPTGAHTYALKLANYNDYTGTVDVIEDQTSQVSATLDVMEGCIIFNTTPQGAKIYIDEVEVPDIVTPGIVCGVSLGTHTYKLVLADYTPMTGSVTLVAGKGAAVSETLTHETGSISFKSTPDGAEIIIDGVDQLVATPATITEITGTHDYTLRKAGYNDYSGVITVSAGQTVTVEAALVPAEGCIYFSTTPAGAKIFIDNMDTGQVTPALVCGLSLGPHTYSLVLTGYLDRTGNVDLTAGQGTIVISSLEKTGVGAGTILALGLLGAGVLGAVILGSGGKTTIAARGGR